MMGRLRFIHILLAALFVAGMMITLQSGRLQAQDATATLDSAPIGVVTPEGVTADQVNLVARELWCPLCNGVRLDACELKACAQMRDVIAIKLGDGESTESIKQHFVDSYGPQVLGAPPFEGFNWLAWLLPPLVLLAGGVFVFLRMRRMTQPAELKQAPAAGVRADAVSAQDDYAQRLEEELKYE